MAQGKKKRRDPKKDPRQEPPIVDLDFTEGEEGEEEHEPERIELFKYKNTSYYLTTPDATLMLKIMEAAAERGEIGAIGFLLKEVIGAKTYEVLKSIPDLKKEELNAVVERAMHFTLGQMEETLGN